MALNSPRHSPVCQEQLSSHADFLTRVRLVLLCVPVASAGREARAQTSDQAWVKRSDALAQILVGAQAPFDPEKFSFFGIAQYDDQAVNYGVGPHAPCELGAELKVLRRHG